MLPTELLFYESKRRPTTYLLHLEKYHQHGNYFDLFFSSRRTRISCQNFFSSEFSASATQLRYEQPRWQ